MSCTTSLTPDTSILSDGHGLTHVTRNVSLLRAQATTCPLLLGLASSPAPFSPSLTHSLPLASSSVALLS